MKDPFESYDFNDLVSWATWQVIEGITKGTPLRAILHNLLATATMWQQQRTEIQERGKL